MAILGGKCRSSFNLAVVSSVSQSERFPEIFGNNKLACSCFNHIHCICSVLISVSIHYFNRKNQFASSIIALVENGVIVIRVKCNFYNIMLCELEWNYLVLK